MDNRIKKLAQVLVGYSCHLQKGEKILIEAKGADTEPLVRQLIKEVYEVGGIPFVNVYLQTIERELLLGASQKQLETLAQRDRPFMDGMDAYITLKGETNAAELSDVSADKQVLYSREYVEPVHFESRLLKTKWVVVRYPTGAMAQSAGMSTEAFEEFLYRVCTLDYSKMDTVMEPLKSLMERTDRVHIKGPGTDLRFSIKNIPAVKCSGHRNIPDGEVFTAPVRTSVNGTIAFNTPSLNDGFTFENIRLEFQDGKIIKATCNDTTRLNKILDTDEGARYIGEFALGVNPYITKPMNNIFFDEKITGSFHFTPGKCYDDADNGNRSAIHWDMVLLQTNDFGGGEIYFDDVLVRKNGLFVLPELSGLNPEALTP